MVIGEAMLTMQGEKSKKAIVDEAYRVLRPGGRYAIHELGLVPDSLPAETKDEIRREMARAIKSERAAPDRAGVDGSAHRIRLVISMRRTFGRHRNALTAVAIVAVVPGKDSVQS